MCDGTDSIARYLHRPKKASNEHVFYSLRWGLNTTQDPPTRHSTSSSCIFSILDSQTVERPIKEVYILSHSVYINDKSFDTYVLRVSGGLVGTEGAPSRSRPSSSPMPPMSVASSPKSSSEWIRVNLMSLSISVAVSGVDVPMV